MGDVSNTLNPKRIRYREKPGSRGGDPGGGTAEGGPEETLSLVNVVYGQQADLAQLFVSEKGLFFLAGDLGVAKSAFARKATEFLF